LVVLALVFGAGLEPRAAQENKDREALVAAASLASKFHEQGKYAEAARALQKAVDLADRVFGADHPSTARLANNLAAQYRLLGEFTKAEPLFRRALRIFESKLGKDHLEVGNCLNNLAAVYYNQDKFAKSEALYLRSLRIWESKLGDDHPTLAAGLHNLATLYRAQGNYAKAEPLIRRSLKIRQAKLPKDHLDVAQSPQSLAALYFHQSQYPKAQALLERSLKIFESRLGQDHPRVAKFLNNLAVLYRVQGQYAKAEPLLRRSLKIQESRLAHDHPDIALTLSNLAQLYAAQGEYAKAEPLYKRSIHIIESKWGPDHLKVAEYLNNLASLYNSRRLYTQVEPLLVRALKIKESKLGTNHFTVAQCLNNLAWLYYNQRRYAKAESLYQRSLKIKESQLTKDHPDVAISLCNLGWLYQDQGKYAKAEPLYRRSLRIFESHLGKDHPHVAQSLSSLAWLHGARRRWQDAAQAFDAARRSQRAHIGRVLPALGPQEQLLFLHEIAAPSLFVSLSLAWHRPEEPGLAERSAAWLVNGKGLTQEALAAPLLLARVADQPELRKLFGQLVDTRKQLAQLSLAFSQRGQEKQRGAQIGALNKQERQLTRELGQKSGLLLETTPWVELAAVRKALRADAVLIDIARFPVFNFQAKGSEQYWWKRRYAAWVIPPKGNGTVRLIDLGNAALIETAATDLRHALQQVLRRQRGQSEAETEKQLAQPLKALARLVLQPLLPHIGQRRRWVISPDGALWLVPWAALPLPDGSYAIEKYTISHVISGRDLVHQKANAHRSPKAGRSLVIADPDFDLVPRRAEGVSPLVRGLLPEERLPRFGRLPGTAAEARAIAPLLERFGKTKPEVWTGKKALEQTFKAARQPRVVVLSTHGYFLEDQADVAAPRSGDLVHRGLKLVGSDLLRPQEKAVKVLENPLLRCGLALAGANHRDKVPAGAEDGILTGLEIVGSDLRGCELVVLSACETGVGQVRNGEGVSGLRQAFQLAGAQSVVATLWQIPDQETTALMTAFFQNLADKKSKAEALRRAQLRIIKERRAKHKAAHPFYWAAFTLTGQAQ
jgi:CHAT domain-containing protein/Tfp pilus assembly protein PilF